MRDAKGRERNRPKQGDRQRTTTAPSERAHSTDAARMAAFDLLRAVNADDAYANLALPQILAARRLHGRDAAFATELAYGSLRMRGTWDAVIAAATGRDVARLDAPVLDVLRLGVHQILAMRVPTHAAVSETVGLARARVGAGAAGLVNAALRRVTEASPEVWMERITAGLDDDAATAVRTSHPAWVVRALRESLANAGRDAAELPDLLAADNAAPVVTLVARPGLVSVDELLAEAGTGATAGRWSPTAVVAAGDPGRYPSVRAGRAGVQDEGSQLVTQAFLAAAVDGDDALWLDMCAGPGGKAALLAAAAAQRGATLVANEVLPHRTALVSAALAAVQPTPEVRTGDGREIGADEPERYDRVLLDAPCTGLGALRRRPEARWRRTPADLPVLSTLQRELLVSAAQALRVGGVLGYVTCSPHLAETTMAVRDGIRSAARLGVQLEVLDAVAAARSVAPELPHGSGPHLQLWPHVHGTDAMHLTLLRRVQAPA